MTDLTDDQKTRVLGEKLALDEKVSRLGDFIGTNPAISSEDFVLLAHQHALMTCYSDVLGKRIRRFQEGETE